MRRIFTNLLPLILVCTVASASGALQHTAKSQKTPVKPSPSQAKPATAPQPSAPAEATPEHGPSSPPEVDFRGGRLTIVAKNSTMNDVLNAVRQKTGAAIDMPPGSGERVVGQFGPGAPRDVIAQLLNGSHFDYVLLGAPADPGALKKIVLMAKASGPEPAPQPPPPQEDQSSNENLQTVPDVETQTYDNSGEATPNGPEPAEEEAPPDQSDQEQNPPVVKTPEELLRELQQQQQQQQQQQEQEQPPPGAPGAPPQ
ncbi:MAG TPA: hypothetical protein VH596_07320 [Terriglobales bacterium]